MTQPAVSITELDGALGVLPPSSGKLYALVGPAASGTNNVPQTFSRVKDAVSAFTRGKVVQAAAHFIERYGRACVIVKTAASVAGSYVGLDVTGVAGTSVITMDAATFSDDDYEVVVLFVTGGTRGTDGIMYKYSLDGGRNYSAVTALGTGNSIVIPNSGGIKIDLAAGTIIANDVVTVRAVAPTWNAADLGAALDALKLSSLNFEIVHIVGALDATTFDTVDLKAAAFHAAGKFITWIGNTRVPNIGESEAAYLTALNTIFSAKSSKYGALCAGACKLTSSVDGRKYKRPVSHVAAAREAYVSEEVDTADVNLGSLVGVSIRDANGNPDEHDETANPGLDDGRFYVLRTFNEVQGVYVNRPRIFSADGSDFYLIPHRRVLNLAHAALRAYFVRRLSKPVLVNKTTGKILEEEALEIEAGAIAAMEAVLMAKPKASGVTFVLSRDDNLLSTKTLNGQARVIPLAYPEFINLDLGFTNPALQVVAA